MIVWLRERRLVQVQKVVRLPRTQQPVRLKLREFLIQASGETSGEVAGCSAVDGNTADRVAAREASKAALRAAGPLSQGPLSLLPIYSTYRGLKPKDFEVVIPHALAFLKTIHIADPLPRAVVEEHDLMGIAEAIESIHKPRKGRTGGKETIQPLIHESRLTLLSLV